MSAHQTIGVIIARQGSKGVPGKNMMKLKSRSILEWTIRCAKRAKTLDRVVLSTDSTEMARIGKMAGAEVPFLRPKRLARDRTHTPPVIEHAVNFIEKKDGLRFDLVVTLQPTSPFRQPDHIDKAVRLLSKDSKLDSVITVKETQFPPYWMFRAHRGILSPLFKSRINYSLLERQQLPETVQPNGAVYVTRRSLLGNKGMLFSAFTGGRCGFVLMNRLSSVDIDNEDDLIVARIVAANHPELFKAMS